MYVKNFSITEREKTFENTKRISLTHFVFVDNVIVVVVVVFVVTAFIICFLFRKT